jgi:hypothetical protein
VTDRDPPLLVPEGTRLLHIGPPKTGTSSLQAAFHQHREATLGQGVRYAGSSRHSGSAVLALTGRRSFGRDAGPPPMTRWNNLLADVRGAREPRVLISSEFFADAEAEAVHRAVEDLDRERLHVVVTLRPLDRIIPSQWQQYVQSDLRTGFDAWLEGTLRNPPGPTPTFWRRHRHDRLVERWAAEVGPERMSIVVIDERDHDHILRVFEQLLGLRRGTLVADDEVVNRSMTWPEIEAVRAFNIAFREAGLANALFHKAMHFGAASYMKTREPLPDEPRIRVPDWAREPIADVAREMVANLKDAGIRVVGDLDTLVPATDDAPSDRAEGESRGGSASTDLSGSDLARDAYQPCITPEVAAAMAIGMAVISGHTRGRRGTSRRNGAAERAELARYATYQLYGAVLGRMRRVPGRAIEWARDRMRGGPDRIAARAALTELTASTEATHALAVELERRARHEGLIEREPTLYERMLAFLGQAVSNLAPGAGPAASACVPPEVAAWAGLGALEASGIVRAIDPAARPGRLRPTLWWWLEPPELARIPTWRIALAAPARMVRGLRRRAARRRGSS